MDNWNPLTDTVPIHSWIHPWLPLLQSRLEPLYPPIRSKLSNALQRWHPSDPSARLILQPWKDVFTPGAWEAFMVKNIIPKLGISFISQSFSIPLLWREYNSLQSDRHMSMFFKCFFKWSVMSHLFLLSSVSRRTGYQPSPAADGAVSLGDGLGGHVVPLQPCVSAGQKLLFKVVAGLCSIHTREIS